jgi:PKD repeat protein
MTVRANGYKTKTIPGIAVPAQGSVVTNILLAPDTGWYATKLVSCRIPGNNFGDEGYTPGCIGAPDGVPYAMGRNGWITLDMGDTLYNGPGNDFTVVQSGTTNKSFTVTGSQFLDGPFTTIGTGNGTTSFDIPTTLGKLRYLYIKDNGSGSASGIGAGFNLDAVRMITPPLKVNFTVSNPNPCANQGIDFTDLSGGNPILWTWSFPGGNPSSSTQQNPTGITYPVSGIYPVTLTISNGFSSLTSTISNFITVLDTPVANLGNDTLLCDNQHITLNAGNPGASWLWSTGATTQEITVDSTGTGYGTVKIWVKVTSQNGCAGSDTVNITFDECTSLNHISGTDRIIITPNPAGSTTNILIPKDYSGKWALISPTGSICKDGLIPAGHDGNLSLKVADLPSGVYFFRLTHGECYVMAKLIIARP